MNTTDWKFDFSSLPHWENRQHSPFISDEFHEIPQSDMLCCIYSISEVTMCNPLGFLAILKNKEKPELYLSAADRLVFCNNFSVSQRGDLVFLQPSIYKGEANRIKRPILIIDVCKNAFSYIDTDNINPCYKVAEINHAVFKIIPDEVQAKSNKQLRKLARKTIRIKRLKWRDLSELESLPDLISF